MKRNGFTLVELIGTVVVIAIVTTIAVNAYGNISLKMKETAYENKVSYIENAASKYASETGYLGTIVDELVKQGYIEADNNNGDVINPTDNTVMNCYIVTITEENGIFYGKYTDTELEKTNGVCDIKDLNVLNINLDLKVYENKVYNSNEEREDFNNKWTRENVILEVSFKSEKEKEELAKKVTKITWISNSGREEVEVKNDFESKNTKEVNVEQIMNTSYRVEVLLEDGTIYQAKANVKIDKQRPVIYKDETKIEKENTYTNKEKKVTITGSDLNGSGIDGYYVGPESNCLSDKIEYKNNEEYENKEKYTVELDNGTYYVCLKDKVGNVSEDTSTKIVEISGVDKNPKPENVTLTYDNDGGSGCDRKTVTKGSKWGELCTPEKDDYIFLGWYSDRNYITYVGSNTIANSSITVYAYWIKKEKPQDPSNQSWEFDYTGNIQTFIVPQAGTYQLEIWGAQGGPDEESGGYGGYATGKIDLTTNDTLYIGVGGQGDSYGGYNGGGEGGCDVYDYRGGGGGATHIALNNNLGLLANYEDNQEDILIVAGGGGGGIREYAQYKSLRGGSGGGNQGQQGKRPKTCSSKSNCITTIAKGGTKNAGGSGGKGYMEDGTEMKGYSGSFGQGGGICEKVSKVIHTWLTGGGGGWYGGGESGVASDYAASAGGGSGYINSDLDDRKMYSHCTSNSCTTYETKKVDSEATSNIVSVKKGNGYVIITYLGF